MELHEILKKIASDLGKKVLTDNNIVNIISDYDPSAFEPQSLKNILKIIVSDDYLDRLFNSDSLNETEILKNKDEFIKKYGFQKLQIEYIIDSFRYGLGEINQITPYSQRVDSDNESLKTIQDGYIVRPKTVNRDNLHSVESTVPDQPLSYNKKIPKVPSKSNKKQSKSSGCGCLIIGLVVLGILGAIFGKSEPEISTNDPNSPDTILLTRKEMDTIRYNDGTPKGMALTEKHDIQLILGKDSLILITPYECMYPSICFDDGPLGSFYNKLTKEFNTELVYEFQLEKTFKDSFIYSLPRNLFPSFKEDERICDVWFFYIPVQIAKKHLFKDNKYDTILYLDLLEGSEADYKSSFTLYDKYKPEYQKLKNYLSL